ncbi:unnamed protein product [Amoebophrya sp. A25]|nr:unnamed protein product [Amoebophrya sp. A25]|eukprot:GSA25T00005609001.1
MSGAEEEKMGGPSTTVDDLQCEPVGGGVDSKTHGSGEGETEKVFNYAPDSFEDGVVPEGAVGTDEESTVTPLPCPAAVPGPRAPENTPARWLSLLRSDRAPVAKVTPDMVDSLKQQMYQVFPPSPIGKSATPGLQDPARSAALDRTNKAIASIESMGGDGWEEAIRAETAKLKQGYEELQRLQRQASVKEARLMAEIEEKETKWEGVVKEMIEKYEALEQVAEERHQRKEMMWETNQKLLAELEETAKKKDYYADSLKSFVGRKSTCAVCAYVNHHEKILVGYEEKNEELVGKITTLEGERSKAVNDLLAIRKQLEFEHTKYKAMEHSCRHFRKKLEQLHEDLKRIEEFKARVAQLEEDLKMEKKKAWQYADEVEPHLEAYEKLKPMYADEVKQNAENRDQIALLEGEKADLIVVRDGLTADLSATAEKLEFTAGRLEVTTMTLQKAKETLLKNVLKGWLVDEDPWELPRTIIQVWRDYVPDLREDNRVWRLEKAHEVLKVEHRELEEVHAKEMADYAQLQLDHATLVHEHEVLNAQHDECTAALAAERETTSQLRADLEAETKKCADFQFRLNQTCDSLEDTEKQLHDLNVLFAQRVNSLFELEEEVKKLRAENDRLWERQGITVCDKHFLKPVWPKALLAEPVDGSGASPPNYSSGVVPRSAAVMSGVVAADADAGRKPSKEGAS